MRGKKNSISKEGPDSIKNIQAKVRGMLTSKKDAGSIKKRLQKVIKAPKMDKPLDLTSEYL